jgi:catechol 2,3-dioxygenase-like lactoylglutathione lyase family enzyme
LTRGLLNHVDLTVKSPKASFAFYDAVLGFMGYRCVNEDARGFDWNIGEHGGPFCSIGVKRAEGAGASQTHDRYSPGLHHLAWNAASRADVDALYQLLLEIGAEVLDAPADYPDYGAGYYAVFFADPDGLKLEYTHWPAHAAAAT